MNTTHMPDNPHWLIIANPAAGQGSVKRRWPLIERHLQELNFTYTVKFTEQPGHAVQLVQEGIRKNFRYILGIGGDGTNHEIINGILGQTDIPATDLYYALLPNGTGNDWARLYNIPGSIAARLQKLQQIETVLQDVGLVSYQFDGLTRQRYFVNVAGLAYDGYIVQQLQRTGGAGRFKYLLMIGKYLLKYKLLPAVISFNSQIVRDTFYTINVGIGRYSGGGMQLVPQADPADGLLALTFVRKLPKWSVMLQTFRLYKGTILEHSRVEGHQTTEVRVDHLEAPPTLLEADGEFLGHTPAVFTVKPNAIRVVV